MSMRSRIIKGLNGQIFSQAVNILIQLGQFPILLACWGTHQFGEWMILMAVPQYFMVFESGLAGATYREMNKYTSKGEYGLAVKVFHSGLSLAMGCCLPIIVGIWAFSLLSQSFFLNNFMMIGCLESRVILCLLSVNIVQYIATNYFYSGFFCSGKYGLGATLSACLRLFDFISLCVVAYFTGSPLYAAVALLLSRLIGNIFFYVRVKSHARWFTVANFSPNYSIAHKLIGPSLSSIAIPVSNALNIQGLRFVVGVFLGPVPLVAFTAMRTISRICTRLSFVITKVMEMEMGRARARNDIALLQRFHSKLFLISVIFGIAVTFVVALFGQDIIRIWTSNKVVVDSSVFIVLVLVSLVYNLWSTSLIINLSFNKQHVEAICYFSLNIILIGSSYVCWSHMHLFGISVFMFLIELVMLGVALPISLRSSQDTFLSFIRRMAR